MPKAKIASRIRIPIIIAGCIILMWLFAVFSVEIVQVPIIKDFSDFQNDYYSYVLQSLDEKALHNSKDQIYRISLFQAFSTAVVVRIEINKNGTADVYCKVEWYYTENGEINSMSEKAKIDKNKTQEFLALINEVDFWNIPEHDEVLGLDGWRVLVEGVKNRSYHFVDRFMGYDEQVYKIEKYFFTLLEQEFSIMLEPNEPLIEVNDSLYSRPPLYP